MYDQYYGFSGRPFQLTPDPEFYFESASHKKAMSYLGYGLNQGEGFIVITGEVGAGKSTLVAHLMERIDPEALTVAHVVTSALDGEELIQVVAQSFGLAVDGKDKAGALGAIEQFLQDEARAGRRCLLIVDECQNLEFTALEELRMLSNFQLGSHPLLQSLLLGQPEFRRTLAHHPNLDQLRQRIIASHHLEALDEEELEDYVHHRLTHVGWENQPSLGEGLLPALYQATDGIPRRVNQIMNRILLLGAIEERDEIGVRMLDAVLEEMNEDHLGGSRAPSASVEVDQPSPALELEETQTVEPEMAQYESGDPDPFAGDIEMAVPAVPVTPEAEAEIESVPAAEVAAIMAQRDARTAELEAAIGELQAAGADRSLNMPHSQSDEDLNEALGRIEARLEEQERSFRHVLTMLIEWLEDDRSREAA
ncbi:general secretion pathway protein [Erythrobacter longus]|uniref:General secretion pathway protein n=1 Tax=Erythrobacter longus TaxID=1044 RepID=A0A074MDP7_ERYLO|nr:XrtA/PEP-CTERM system-associated ATPase [Erythrobacter longus]KEO91569.1 general secretion pathway protein [Erythrobacter longus]